MKIGASINDLTGKKFGRLTVVGITKKIKYKRRSWKCKCDCGNTVIVRGDSLIHGAKSCGCLSREISSRVHKTHGLTQISEYGIWASMIQRCINPKTHNYPLYGGRGITVCKRWTGKNGFVNFLNDMGRRPSMRHSLDRYPNNDTGNYEPSNCRWGTVEQQNRTRRSNRFITYNGETLCVMDWSIKLNIPHGTLYSRLNTCGWSEREALETPLYGKR